MSEGMWIKREEKEKRGEGEKEGKGEREGEGEGEGEVEGEGEGEGEGDPKCLAYIGKNLWGKGSPVLRL